MGATVEPENPSYARGRADAAAGLPPERIFRYPEHRYEYEKGYERGSKIVERIRKAEDDLAEKMSKAEWLIPRPGETYNIHKGDE